MKGAISSFETNQVRKYIPEAISDELKNTLNKGTFSFKGNGNKTFIQSSLELDKSSITSDVQFNHTNFSNLKNKELNEGFEESVFSNKTGKKIKISCGMKM